MLEREIERGRGMNWFGLILILGGLDDLLSLHVFPAGISFIILHQVQYITS